MTMDGTGGICIVVFLLRTIAQAMLLLAFAVNAQNDSNLIAIMDLEADNVSIGEAKTLTSKLRFELVNCGRFNVLERGQMEEILKEQGFQQTGCISTECAVQAGQLLGVKKMIAGSIGRVGSIYLITVRKIDVTTGRIVQNFQVEIPGAIEDVLRRGIPSAAYKLAGIPRMLETPNSIAADGAMGAEHRRAIKFEILYDEDFKEPYDVVKTEMTDLSEIDGERDVAKYRKRALESGCNGIIFKKSVGMKMNDPGYQIYQVRFVRRK